MVNIREPWRGTAIDPYLGWVKAKDLPSRPEPAFLIGTPEYPIIHDVSTVMYGRPKAGKSMAALTAAHSLITGDPFMGIFPVRETRTVGYLALDSGQVWETRRRIDKWGDPALGELFVSGVKPEATPGEWSRMASRLEAMGVDFLFIDNLARLKGGMNRSLRNDEDVDPLLANLDVLEAHGIAFCLLHHAGKPGEDGAPRSTPLGATTIEAWARNLVQVNAVPVKDSSPRRTRRWLEMYGNDLEGEQDRPQVHFTVTDKGIVPVPGEGPKVQRSDATKQKREEIRDWVLENIPEVTNKAEAGRRIKAALGGNASSHAQRLSEGAYGIGISGGRWVPTQPSLTAVA